MDQEDILLGVGDPGILQEEGGLGIPLLHHNLGEQQALPTIHTASKRDAQGLLVSEDDF